MGKRELTFSASNESTHTDPDFATLRRVIGREVDAFEALFRKYHRRIYQFVFRLLRDPELTDEVVNDAMVVVWENAHRFQGTGRVSTWMFGIAYRKGLKALQRRSRRTAAESDEDCEVFADASPNANPERNVGGQERIRALRSAMQSLSAEKQSVVELTAMGYSYREIAEIIGCPENTVKTRMFHARERLRTLLVGYEE